MVSNNKIEYIPIIALLIFAVVSLLFVTIGTPEYLWSSIDKLNDRLLIIVLLIILAIKSKPVSIILYIGVLFIVWYGYYEMVYILNIGTKVGPTITCNVFIYLIVGYITTTILSLGIMYKHILNIFKHK